MATDSPASSLEFRRLGRVPYAEALALQEELRETLARGEGPETVLLLEHPDVLTYGPGAKPENRLHDDTELRRLGYDVFRVRRGGDATWHGPGQLVGYPILNLARRGSDVHRYVRTLENALIAALSDFGLEARSRQGFAGVWLDERRKIASIGVGIRRWLTIHGFALNVNCDLTRFDAIVPCGLAGVRMVSIASELGGPVDAERVAARVEDALRKALG
jgi:lipoyl(octanoyl) transferase